MYSIINPRQDSFDEIMPLVEQVLRVKDVDSGADIPIVICGNKVDKDESERAIAKQEGQELAAIYNIAFFETAGKYSINVDAVIDSIIAQTIEFRKPRVKHTEKKQCDVM
jgi:GTPase SAR1 family protein